jgi:hypothetical protein
VNREAKGLLPYYPLCRDALFFSIAVRGKSTTFLACVYTPGM